jgi:hypothetical protein
MYAAWEAARRQSDALILPARERDHISGPFAGNGGARWRGEHTTNDELAPKAGSVVTAEAGLVTTVDDVRAARAGFRSRRRGARGVSMIAFAAHRRGSA